LQTLRGFVQSRAALHLEVLALRHQLQVLETVAAETTATRDGGSVALGLAIPVVDRMAHGAHHRQARHRHRMASAGLSLVVDLEKSTTKRTTGRPNRRPRPDSDHVAGEFALGRASHSR